MSRLNFCLVKLKCFCRVLDYRQTNFQPEAKSIVAYDEGFEFTFRTVQFKIYSAVQAKIFLANLYKKIDSDYHHGKTKTLENVTSFFAKLFIYRYMYIHIRNCTLHFAIVNQYCSNVIQTYNSATAFTSLLAKCIQKRPLSILLWL